MRKDRSVNKDQSALEQGQVRKLALEALIRIEEDRAYSNLVLDRLLQKHVHLSQRDRRLLTQIVYGTVQQQRLLDFQLQPFLKQKVSQLDRWVRQLLRLSVYQIMFLDRIPERAVVHEAVELAGKYGHRGVKGMVNGVLRSFLRGPRADFNCIADPIKRLAVETSHPTWMVKRWTAQYGLEKAAVICRANNEQAPLTLRVNRLKTDPETAVEKLSEEGVTARRTTEAEDGLIVESGGQVTKTTLFRQGFVTIQDESSMLVGQLMAPAPGMYVLDVCAAPGGKTTHLAEYMHDEGYILANDIHPHKEKLIQTIAKRMGHSIIHTSVADARMLSEKRRERFDKVLVDAPCTGFGVIRRKPDLKWHKEARDVADIAVLQYQILSDASLLVKAGGQLVYSTCTIDKQENENVTDRFLDEHRSFTIVPGSTRLILPGEFGGDGFYMTKFVKQ